MSSFDYENRANVIKLGQNRFTKLSWKVDQLTFSMFIYISIFWSCLFCVLQCHASAHWARIYLLLKKTIVILNSGCQPFFRALKKCYFFKHLYNPQSLLLQIFCDHLKESLIYMLCNGYIIDMWALQGFNIVNYWLCVQCRIE